MDPPFATVLCVRTSTQRSAGPLTPPPPPAGLGAAGRTAATAGCLSRPIPGPTTPRSAAAAAVLLCHLHPAAPAAAVSVEDPEGSNLEGIRPSGPPALADSPLRPSHSRSRSRSCTTVGRLAGVRPGRLRGTGSAPTGRHDVLVRRRFLLCIIVVLTLSFQALLARLLVRSSARLLVCSPHHAAR